MAELEVVRPQHQDHQRQRRTDLDALLQPIHPISTRLERILPDRTPSIQAILNHSYSQAGVVQLALQYAGPTLVKRQPITEIGNDAPR
jgi:hypothetical protein